MKCKICKKNTRIIHDTQFSIDYYKCDSCQFISMDQNKKVPFEEEKALYDTHENSIENEGYVNRFKNFIDTGIIPFIQTGTLLDFGSGPEPVLIQVINRDYQFTTDHYDLHYATDKVYRNKQYNIIVSTEVIEHMDEPLEAFIFFRQHLKKNGILAIMTLFHYNEDTSFKKWWYRRDETHISFYTPHTLKILADKTGFELIYHDNKHIATFKRIRIQ